MKFFNKQGSATSGSDGTTRSSSNDPFVLEFEDDGGTVHTEQASRYSSFTSPFSKSVTQTPPPTAPTKKLLGGFGSSSSSSSGKKYLSPARPMRSISPTPIISSKKKGATKTSNKIKALAKKVSFDDQDLNERHTKSSKKSSCCSKLCCCFSCCSSCPRFVKCGLFLLLGAVTGIVIWRYGPWALDKATSTIASFEAAQTCDDCCNGSTSYCDKALDDVLFPMVRRAHSSTANNFVAASNTRPFEEALVAGYRALHLNTCMCESYLSSQLLERDESWGLANSNLGFCNTYCVAGVRDPKAVLMNILTFLETNTREVLVIVLEMGEGSAADLRNVLLYSGLLEYAYIPTSGDDTITWPTLGEMISTNKRLVLFGAGDGMESCPANDCSDGILAAMDHVGLSARGDLTSCAPSNTSSNNDDDDDDDDVEDDGSNGDVPFSLFQMNQYEESQVPSLERAQELNSYATLESRMESCEGYRGPSLLAVEFWDEGEVLKFVKERNTDISSADQRGLRGA